MTTPFFNLSPKKTLIYLNFGIRLYLTLIAFKQYGQPLYGGKLLGIDRNLIDDIKARTDIVEVIREKVTSLKRSGSGWTGLCPFHNDKNPSFSVSPAHGIYKCFSCGESGDVIKFIEKTEGLEFIEAVKFLAKKAGITIDTKSGDFKKDGEYNRREQLAVFNGRAVNYYKHFLHQRPEGKRALDYLNNRGLSKETMDHFNIGYAPPDRGGFERFLLKKGFTREFLLTTGLFSNNNNRFRTIFYDRVMFPIYDYRGDCIGFGGRALSDAQMPKYINTPETALYKKSRSLYGISLAKKDIIDKKKVYLVEGYMDVITTVQSGIKNVVAPCGTAVTKDQLTLLSKYAEEVILLLDNDQAGIKGGLKGIKEGVNSPIRTSVMILDDAKDPDEYFRHHTANEFESLSNKRVDGFEFMLHNRASDIDVTDVRRLNETVSYFFEYIRQWESEIVQNGLVERLSNSLKVDKRLLSRDFIKFKNSGKYNIAGVTNAGKISDIPEVSIDDPKKFKEKQFRREVDLNIILSKLQFRTDIVKKTFLSEEFFVYPENRDIFNSINIEEYSSLNKNFIDNITDNTLRDFYVASIFSDEINVEDDNLLINICIDRIADLKKKHFERIRDKINQKIKLGVFYKDDNLVKEMQEEKSLIVSEIIKLNRLQELKNTWKTS